MSLLSDAEVRDALAGSAWAREGDAIVREWRFEDFAAAVRFVDRVAEAAEAAGHHPDILLHGWNRVRLTLSTHSEGGITANDVGLARTLDGLA
jgi:4a-hydroxytetrahydrobiopterin dehydratase